MISCLFHFAPKAQLNLGKCCSTLGDHATKFTGPWHWNIDAILKWIIFKYILVNINVLYVKLSLDWYITNDMSRWVEVINTIRKQTIAGAKVEQGSQSDWHFVSLCGVTGPQWVNYRFPCLHTIHTSNVLLHILSIHSEKRYQWNMSCYKCYQWC